MNPGLLFSGLPVIGIVIGLLRVRFRRLPWNAAGLVVIAYLLYVAATGAYAARCWDCAGDVTATRGDSFLVGILFFGLMLAVTLAGIALGARLTLVLARLFGAARDVRAGLRKSHEEDRPPVS